jgi:SPP1 family predicted phage head-tail adaptor
MAIVSNTDARRCDQRITFQQKVTAQDPNTGEITFTWADFATIWACIDATKASERFAAQQELSGNDFTIWIRWRGDIDSNMRILWNDRIFDITGIPDQQRRGRWLSVFVTAGINNG